MFIEILAFFTILLAIAALLPGKRYGRFSLAIGQGLGIGCVALVMLCVAALLMIIAGRGGHSP